VSSRVSSLGDHSLLLKYLNPHTVAITTLSEVDRQLTLTLIDSVSLRILYRAALTQGEEPVHTVIIENFVVVTYWNTKAQRGEMSTIALYEGMVGANELGPFSTNSFADEAPFSSFTALPPIALQKTFVTNRAVAAIQRTFTKQGLSNKNVLIATSSGQLQSIDMRYLHPRRPLAVPSKTEKEEGLLQYIPYLHINPRHVISLNATIEGLAHVISVPSNLESTSLILGYGLDLFYTHDEPSQSFDILSSDFNSSFLVIILTGLFLAVIILKRKANKKVRNTSWV
jgi:hypothetical protein